MTNQELEFMRSLIEKINRLEQRVGQLEGQESASIVSLKDGVTAPTASTGTAYIYVDTSDGDLKVRYGDNVTKTIATDT
jgi:hypothetical protein